MSRRSSCQKEILSSEPQTVTLTVNRGLVPWYGEGTDEIVVTSNGLDKGATSSTVRIDLNVTVDPACAMEAGCAKPGFYCDPDQKICTAKLDLGQECAVAAACNSGVCAQGVCCSSACDQACQACDLAGSEGTCSPVAPGEACDDGEYCTTEDVCENGKCVGGESPDCSDLDTPCGNGVCDEEADQCRVDVPADKCALEGKCYDDMEPHPDVACLLCQPTRSQDSWSTTEASCYIADTCYESGGSLPGECLICHPESPFEASTAADGMPCDDDGDTCTSDVCQEGVCVHTALEAGPCDDQDPCTKNDQCSAGQCGGESYSCDDQLECTEELCQGDGSCANNLADDACLIENQCFGADAPALIEPACQFCSPAESQDSWTARPDGLNCDDNDLCTEADQCALGVCGGNPVQCGDSLACTADSCVAETGQCANVLQAGWCLIDETCVAAASHPEGPDSQCRICDPQADTMQWTALNEGLNCDDQSECSAESICQSGTCTPVGPLCDDGNECTEDLCSAEGECTHENLGNGTACEEDLVACTDDVCLEGSCVHPVSAGSCLIDGICRTNEEGNPDNLCQDCDAAANSADWSPANEDMPCDDGLYCKVDETCKEGVCTGVSRDCGGDQCNDEWCLEDQEKCVVQAEPDGGDCSDGNACTLDDKCQAGICQGGMKDCSEAAENNPCLEGWCDPESEPEAGACKPVPLSQDVPCGDALGCTTDTVCDGEGICGSGLEVLDEDCEALLGNKDPCVDAICKEPDGCVLVPREEGAQCESDNAFAQCLQGDCTVVQCDDGFGNCDGGQDNGCEIDLRVTMAHCGECDNVCELDNATYTCFQSQCVVIFCDDGFDNCDKQPETGCETSVQEDAENCGECNSVCHTEDTSVVGIYVAGQCQEEDCPEGALDADGNPGNGCENQAILFVDSWNAGDLLEDGTSAHPFDTIQEAVDEAPVGYTVYVKDGGYQAGVLISKADLLVLGESRDGVVIQLAAGETGFTVSKGGVTIQSMTVVGGRYGLKFDGNPAQPVVGGGAKDLLLTGQKAPNGGIADMAAGIVVDHAEQLEVSGVEVNGVTGGNSKNAVGSVPSPGGMAVGIHGYGVFDSSFDGNILHGFHGGKAGDGGGPVSGSGGAANGFRFLDSSYCTLEGNSTYSLDVGAAGYALDSGGQGGDAAGIHLDGCAGFNVTDNEIGLDGAIIGGSGNTSGYNGSHGTGGMASGIYLVDSEANSFSGNAVAGLVGADGGPYGNDEGMSDQVTFGFYLESDSLDNTLDDSNSVEDDQVVYLYGVSDVVVADYVLESEANPTNWGKMAIIDCTGIVVSGNTVANYTGRTGRGANAGYFIKGGAGAEAFGIRVETCVNCQVTDNVVSGIVGGMGGHASSGGVGGNGGASAGILVQDCSTTAVEGNSVALIEGGPGGLAGDYGSVPTPYGGTGGYGIGIWVRLSSSTDVRGNGVRFVEGGAGGPWGLGWGIGDYGPGVGFLFNASPGSVFSKNAVALPRGSNFGKAGAASACVQVQGTQLKVDHLTCYGPGIDGLGVGHGVVLEASNPSPVLVTNSILANATGYGLHSLANLATLLKADYTALFECALGESNNAAIGTDCLHDEDPKFSSAPAGKVTLLPSSPCIDAGDPAAEYTAEPAPNGCRVNLGAYGGTDKATAKADAEHCE